MADQIDSPKAEQVGVARHLDLRELIRLHHAALYRYAYRLSGSVADAEDLTQQTFLVAQAKLHQVRDEQRVKSWLFAVLRSCFLKSCRKNTPLSATEAELQVDQIPASSNAEDDLDSDQLQRAVNSLPAEYRVVVLMFYFEERSYKEIAASLDLPIGTVMSRLSRAKGRLRRLLNQESTSPSATPTQIPPTVVTASSGNPSSGAAPR